jgi:methyl-accepting chemotaxis protein
VKRAVELLDALREALGAEPPDVRSAAVDDALLFRACENAEQAAEAALAASQAAGASSAQQRGALEATADSVKLLFSRAREGRAGLTQTREALEQIRLVALNAGLEGARLGDPLGKPLVLVAEDVRAHAVRALAALEQHDESLAQLDRDREKLRAEVESASLKTSEVARDLLQTQAAQRDVSTALADVSERMKRVTRTDAETARLLADAADHARALTRALGTLETRPGRASLLGSLGPSLGPLRELLRTRFPDDSSGRP